MTAYKLCYFSNSIGDSTGCLKTKLIFDLGEIKTIEIRKGHKLKDNVFNVEEVKKILNYNMPLSQLYDSMYPDDEEQDAFEVEIHRVEIHEVETIEDYDDLPF